MPVRRRSMILLPWVLVVEVGALYHAGNLLFHAPKQCQKTDHDKAKIPLRRLCDFHRNFPTGKVVDTNHESLRHKSCCRLSWSVSAKMSPTFPVYCNGLNSIRTTQTGLSRTLLQTSWHVDMVCIRDFHDLCQQLSLRGSFGESQRNEIWA